MHEICHCLAFMNLDFRKMICFLKVSMPSQKLMPQKMDKQKMAMVLLVHLRDDP